jgi:hypothetical protein
LYKQPDVDFHIATFAAQFLDEDNSFDVNAMHIRAALSQQMSQIYKMWTTRNNTEAIETYKWNTFFLAAIEDGKPRLAVIKVSYCEDDEDLCESELIEADYGYLSSKRMIANFNANVDRLKQNLLDAAIELIEGEIKDCPEFVGYPINAVRLKADKITTCKVKLPRQ